MKNKTNNEWEKDFDYILGNPKILEKYGEGFKKWGEETQYQLKSFIRQLLSSERQRLRGVENEKLLDQLYRLEGILGKYNCQHGGTKCEFQTNCHRLIREEIEKLKLLE